MPWDFREQLDQSQEAGVVSRCEGILRGYFASAPDFAFDGDSTKREYLHDFEVVAFGEHYKIEHKHRPRADYGDELLEDVSNDQSGRQGWTWGCSSVDYVLYTYAISRRWTIWPGPELEAAWRANRDYWVQAYGILRALNRGYITLNVAVPTRVLVWVVAEAGAPYCLSGCGRNVGRFGARCTVCQGRSCCAVSDGEWICGRCAKSA